MQVRAPWRAVRSPGERLVGWAVLMPSGRGVIIGSAFAMGVIVPILLPLSVLVTAWGCGSGRRLGLLTDRRVIVLRPTRAGPVFEGEAGLDTVRVRAGRDADAPVRVWLAWSEERSGWFRPGLHGVERRFVDAARVLARADGSGAVC